MSYVRPMSAVANPALNAFVAHIGDELIWAQVLIRSGAGGYELRHRADRSKTEEALSLVAVSDVRQLAQAMITGAFRPLKSAPNLRSGWRIEVRDAVELEAALNQLYPGSIADWFAARSSTPPVTHYRQFTDRQTGMYRITTKLTDAHAAQVIRSCCHASLCLKQRLWSVVGLETDSAVEKSAIPCLEPCAVLLEFARKAMRLEQEEKTSLALGPSETESLAAALERALAHPDPALREGDVEAPSHARRLRLLLGKLRATLPTKREPADPE